MALIDEPRCWRTGWLVKFTSNATIFNNAARAVSDSKVIGIFYRAGRDILGRRQDDEIVVLHRDGGNLSSAQTTRICVDPYAFPSTRLITDKDDLPNSLRSLKDEFQAFRRG